MMPRDREPIDATILLLENTRECPIAFTEAKDMSIIYGWVPVPVLQQHMMPVSPHSRERASHTYLQHCQCNQYGLAYRKLCVRWIAFWPTFTLFLAYSRDKLYERSASEPS